MDLTRLLSSQGRKNRMITAPPITTTPQNFASIDSISATLIAAATATTAFVRPARRDLSIA